jgi:glutamine synthetase
MTEDSGTVGRSGFVDTFGLWNADQKRQAVDVLHKIEAEKLDFVRVCFVDPHGLVRGKMLAAQELQSIFRNGCAFPSSLILKDTSQVSVISVFSGSAGFGIAGLGGVGDLIMVPDPQTFRILPWSPNTGWILCDIFQQDGCPLPLSTRGIFKKSLADLAQTGHDFVAGLEVEFYVFKREDTLLEPSGSRQPPDPPRVSLLAQGYQYLNETHSDQLDFIAQKLMATYRQLDLPVRSIETEFGPSQLEVTFNPASGLAAADNMILLRTATKQLCHRLGLHATFMCRPALPNVLSSGWHLHQSWRNRETGRNAFTTTEPDTWLSPVGMQVVAGLIAYARESCLFATPTINGYKRYRSLSLAPDRAVWSRDNKGAMVRLVSAGPNDPATRLENRIGEPAANPYLYMASQIVCGLQAMRDHLHPAEGSETPYQAQAPFLPKSLIDSLAALRTSTLYRNWFGEVFVDYMVALKESELSRFLSDVTDWEQREYFSIF